jgi:hypothetical protein
MKFVKTLLAVAALGAVMGAHAESNIATGTTALSAAAKLNFRVVIPKVLFLRVGGGTDYATAATPVDTVTFTPAAGSLGNAVAGATDGTGNGLGTSPGSVAVRLLSTGGNVTLAATSSTTGLTLAGNTIPWTAITSVSSVNTLQAPQVGASNTVNASNGVVFQSADWNFNYSNATAFAAGTYNGVVTYTASIL